MVFFQRILKSVWHLLNRQLMNTIALNASARDFKIDEIKPEMIIDTIFLFIFFSLANSLRLQVIANMELPKY